MRNICFWSRWRQKTLICLSLFSVFVSTISEAAGPPPVITVQPLGITVPEKGTAVFTVVAVSGTSLSYQWYLNNKAINKATSRILTIDKVKKNDAGSYKVTVKNASGTVTSSNAVLIIGPEVKKNLKIDKCKMDRGGFELQLSGLTNNCVIYASTNLVNWTPIATNTPSAGNVNFTDSKATNRPFCYYKAMNQ